MIKPEQIPDEVVEALWKSTGADHIGPLRFRTDAKIHLAAAINAWPGTTHYDELRVFGQPYSPARIMLPLPQRKNDD